MSKPISKSKLQDRKQPNREKSLIETNPYLKDPEMRRKLVERSVRTSCGVEGIPAKPAEIKTIEIKIRSQKKIYKSKKK
jgi:hypothetical protein